MLVFVGARRNGFRKSAVKAMVGNGITNMAVVAASDVICTVSATVPTVFILVFLFFSIFLFEVRVRLRLRERGLRRCLDRSFLMYRFSLQNIYF